MWCPSCRADVAAELSTDNRRMMCARCRTDIGAAAGASIHSAHSASQPRTTEAERDARELLARWSAQNVLEPVAGIKPIPSSMGSSETSHMPPSELRFDPPKLITPAPSTQFVSAVRQQPAPVLQMPSTAAPTSIDAANQSEAIEQEKSVDTTYTNNQHNTRHDDDGHVSFATRRASWMSLAGQLCAYAGVGLLTCGTVLVMWSYFGGPGRYMPTGWLIAAVGQMLLFLGVIALISSGLDQSSHEIGWRINHLAEEVHSMSLALEQMERRMKLESSARAEAAKSQIHDAA